MLCRAAASRRIYYTASPAVRQAFEMDCFITFLVRFPPYQTLAFYTVCVYTTLNLQNLGDARH
jgi:hypothetical protein